MANLRRFAAINAKIKAMEGLLLTSEAYKALVGFEEVKEIIEFLKDTEAYGQLLSQVKSEAIDITELGRLFKEDIIERYERIGHYFTDAYKKFYKLLLIRYEIEDIKLILRTYLRHEETNFLKMHIVQTHYHTVDLSRFNYGSTIEDFIDGLKETPYHNLLKYYLEEDSDKIMFYMEMALDHYYFKTLHKETSNFSNEDKKLINESLGRNIDLQNLQWIYRGLKYYHLSSEELLNYTLNIGYHFKYKDLKEFCYTRDIDQLLQKIQESQYGFLFSESGHSEIFMELNMERYLLKLMIDLKRDHPMTFMETIVYMHRKEYEVRDILTLIEAKRYHAPIEDVKKFLVNFDK